MGKKLSRRILSVMLAAGMISSGFTVPAIAVEASENDDQGGNPNSGNQIIGSKQSDSGWKQYNISVVDKSFLYSHTSPTSEVPNSGNIEKVATTTSDDELYSALGLGDDLQTESEKLLNSSLNTNPLAGYTFVNPEELFVGHIGRSNQHEGWFFTKDNVDVTDISSIDGDFGKLRGSTEDFHVTESKGYQTHNAIGFDCDGDGLDEIAYLGLYSEGMNIRFYDRKKDSDGNLASKWTEMSDDYSKFDLKLSTDNEILDIMAAESKGYTAMTAGDFDHDGVEELAVYAPAANNGRGVPRIVIIKLNCSGSKWSCTTIGEINLTDTYTNPDGSRCNDFDNLKKGSGSFENWRMPVVSLSTTSTRLGNADTSMASTKYETFDDLVINVSVPRVYTDDEDNMDSVTAIYSYDTGKKGFKKMFQDNLNYGNYRMVFTNSTDADLNGDGFDEIVVAGIMETGLSSGNSQSSGSLSSSTNLIQLITWNGSAYETVWSGKDGKEEPKRVEAAGNLDLGHFKSLEPMALSAGHYYTDDTVPYTQDQLCVQGVVLSCVNAKVSGKELYAENNSSGEVSYCVLDTQPYCDVKNYNNCDVRFSKLYKYDISSIAHHNPYIDLAVSGQFMTEAEVEAIVIVSNDTNSSNDDQINYDISIVAYDPEKKQWRSKAYNDFIYHKDEDDNGTSLYVCMIDSDFDSMYYKYTGKYVTYSSPNLYSVVQAPPYYSENNTTSTSVSYSITQGTTTGNKVNWGFGAAEKLVFKIPIPTTGINLNVDINSTQEYIGSYTWKHTETTTQTFNLYTNSDYAVVFTLPIIVNNYSVWYPSANNGKGEWSEMQTTQSLEPIFAALTIDDYNKAVSKITDEEEKKYAPKIANLPKATAGDPIAYYHDYKSVTNDNSDKKKFNDCKQDINDTFPSVSNKIDFTDATEHTEGFNIRFQVMFSISPKGAGGKKAASGKGTPPAIGIVADIGYNHIDANSNGTSFMVSYGGLKKSNMDNVTFLDSGNAYPDYYLEENGKKQPMTSSIVHYQSADYMYSAHAVPYTRSDITNNGEEVYILSYYTDNFLSAVPPEPVKYFGLQSISKTEDNQFKITFAWDSKTRNEDRKADGYNIYVRDVKSGNNQVNLVNTDGPIKKSTTSDITTYTVTGFTDLNSGNYKFYIAPVYINNSSDLTVNVREGILCKSLDINDINQLIGNEEIVISTQPQNQYFKENDGKQKMTFSVDAYDKQTGDASTLSFQWQRYSTSAQAWINVKSTDENGIEFVETSGEHSSVYSFYAAASDCYVPIRCLITVKRSSVNYTVYSTNSVTVLYEIKPESITISPSKASIFDGEKVQFSIKFDPINTSDQSIIWSSSDERIATVDRNGLVTGIKRGNATITAVSGSNPNMKISAQLEVKHQHDYNENGFCERCGGYQPAVLNSDGIYEISNAGQLFWFAAFVNNDATYADFDKSDRFAKAVLVNDIDLEGREWTPIRNFNGSFDGQNHTISHLMITKEPSYTGLFGSTAATLANFTVDGDIILNSPGEHIGGVTGYANGGKISNVVSYVNISNGDQSVVHIGGVVGTITSTETVIENCFYYGTITINNSHDCIGGVVGYTNGGGRIRNCANLGSVTTTKEGAYTGGILGYINTSYAVVQNCYNYGTVSNGDTVQYCGAVIGWVRTYNKNNINNNYYLNTSTSLAFGSGSSSGLTAVSETAEQFASGEVAYLLNNTVTDGQQVWYQNIDNGEISDDYPKFEGGTVYYLEYKDTYSNTYSEAPKADAFDKDEDGNLMIRTYDDLVKLSHLVRSDYDVYGSQNYVLTNNIIAPSDSVWSQGIGSAAENKAFNGTFNGKGYCIIGLNVDSSEYGGLFEIIGKDGCVKDLFVFDCDFVTSSVRAGGIAAINNGTIDHCTSGVHFITGTIHTGNITIDAAALNSTINGEISGGIAAENNGLITGCRNASIVSGIQCGGIAGENIGVIYGCANNSSIGTSASEISGGLAGKNNGKIESSYNSATINGSSENKKGSVAGINGYDEGTPTVTNVFYRTANGLNAVGTDSTQLPDDTNKGLKTYSDFLSDSFVEELNAVSNDTVVWVINPVFNMGYPIIKGNFLKNSIKSAGSDITVEGNMHEDLNISYKTCSKNDKSYKQLSEAMDQANILNVYSVSMTDKDGNYMPEGLWYDSGFKISVPVDRENVCLGGIDDDGKVVYYEPDTVENGMAVFTVSSPTSFAVVEKTNVPDDNNGNDNTDKNDNTSVNTGSESNSLVLLMTVLSMAFIICNVLFGTYNRFKKRD